MTKYGKSPSGNPLTRYVNMHQTPEERKEKYHYLKLFGFCVPYCNQGRDFRWSTIQRNIDYYHSHPKEAAALGLNLEVI